MSKVQFSTDVILNILKILILKCRSIGIVLLFHTVYQAQKMHADNKEELVRLVYVAHGAGGGVTTNFEVF